MVDGCSALSACKNRLLGKNMILRGDQEVEDAPARIGIATIPGMTDLDQRTVRALVRAMPKAELHLHLDGSLRIDTALDIARTRGIVGADHLRRDARRPRRA